MFFRKINSIAFLLLLSMLSIQSQCKKRFGCAENLYSFNLGVKAIPDNDSLLIGDTIWFEIDEPITLKDAQTERMINYSGAVNLGSAIAFQAFSSEFGQFTIEAAKKFAIIVIEGKETGNTNPSLYHEFLFSEINSRYIFRLGIMPLEKGIFRIGFGNAANVYRTNDNCTKASFNLNFKETDQHFYFFPGGSGTIPGGGIYYFKVN